MRNSIFIFLFVFISITVIQAQDTIHVDAGWNMIGAKSTIPPGGFTTVPSGIITSSYYGYKSGVGYSPAETLKDGKGFWVKASQAGILIGGTSSVVSCGEVVLYGGRVYSTVKIGQQCWFNENLDIGTMVSGTTTQTDNGTIEKYCYADNPANCAIYGGFYQWDEAIQYTTTEGTQGICPTGWHLPMQDQLKALGTSGGNDGNALKAIGQGTGGGAGTNTSGFSALLSGYRLSNGDFGGLGNNTNFWSSLENGTAGAYSLLLNSNNSNVDFVIDSKGFGYTVRCLKD